MKVEENMKFKIKWVRRGRTKKTKKKIRRRRKQKTRGGAGGRIRPNKS